MFSFRGHQSCRGGVAGVSLPLRLLVWLLVALVFTTRNCVQVQASSSVSASATFELYDNGASTGGVVVTLNQKDFPVMDDDADADTDNIEYLSELFATKMSLQDNYINVTKYGQAPGTVRATKAFREDGELIVEFAQLLPLVDTDMRRIYLVAEGLEFVWPFIEFGHRQVVSPQTLPPVMNLTEPVVIESISDSPRVFKVYNLFTDTEGTALMENALSLEGEQSLKRSTVGNSKGAEKEGALVDSGRTSANAWDSVSPAAKAMITRTFQLTGIQQDAGKVDGLQLVRYNPGEFYNTHPDAFSQKSDPDFNFDPYAGGSNRFATVFMYITDVEEGGSTVFPEVASPNPTEPPQYALDMFKRGSLEYKLLGECHSKLAVPPQKGTAALFYSVTPDGRIDPKVLHGACPVIKGTKWGANIWIWNKQRFGDIKTGDPRHLILRNNVYNNEPVYITWESKANGVLAPGKTLEIDSFGYHRFKAHQGSHKGPTISEFTVQEEPPVQEWIIQLPKGQQPQPRGNSGADSEL